MSANELCVKGYVSGRVQGVGFRYFAMRHANELKVFGYAKNLRDGRVEFLLKGNRESVQSMVEKLHEGPSFSVVTDVELSECECEEIENRFLAF